MNLSTRTIAVSTVFIFLFIIGFVLMGYEMLGSRYLNPHFGGGITTWAGLISIVLLAMMCGYLTGGYLVDSRPNIDLLSVICLLSGLSIASMTLLADHLLSTILSAFGDQLVGVLLAATAISFVPVALLSASSPFVVRLLLQDLQTGGKTAGWVYGVSTLGNVFGTLITTFTLIPSFGTRTITLYFGIILLLLSVVIFILRNRITVGLGGKTAHATLCIIVFMALFHPQPSQAAQSVNVNALYPEGPLWVKGKLYYAEMSRHSVTVLENEKSRIFWKQEGCGPTAITNYRQNDFLILCHLAAKLVVVDKHGSTLKEIARVGKYPLFQNPNDCHSDGKNGVFFSDAGVFRKGAPSTGIVFHLAPSGQLRKIVKNLSYANGIAFHSEKRILFVSEHLAGKVWAYHLNSDYTVKKRELFFDISSVWSKDEIDYAETGPDGIEILDNGSIAVAVYGKGSVVILNNKKLTQFKVDTKYVTNIAGYGNRIAITGAHSNHIHPFKGKVKIISLNLRGNKIK